MGWLKEVEFNTLDGFFSAFSQYLDWQIENPNSIRVSPKKDSISEKQKLVFFIPIASPILAHQTATMNQNNERKSTKKECQFMMALKTAKKQRPPFGTNVLTNLPKKIMA